MPKHVVIDGSNLATEGRSMPSLKQLVEAVQAFMEEHPKTLVTVVVDATFGHRIDPREVAEFDAAIDHNELVAPPAGAVGRGDAFVLAIANKVDATIVSNDSYQEFHGEYPWLFDDARLIGGKPVPHVGWVFVPRVPVRGPLSRKSQRDAKLKRDDRLVVPRPSKAASQPKPVPDAPPPGAVLPAKTRGRAASTVTAAGTAKAGATKAAVEPKIAAATQPHPAAKTDVPTPSKSSMINDLLVFLAFVEAHPVGSPVSAVVESYSSHGAYVTIDEARGYVPLRNMADPPPRSAREAMKLADEVALVVVGFHAARRGIDLAVPSLAPAITGVPVAEPTSAPAAPAKRGRKAADKVAKAPEPIAEPTPAPAIVDVTAEPARKRGTRKKAATEQPADIVAEAPAAAPAPAPSPTAPAPRAKGRATSRAGTAAPPAAAAVEPAVDTPPAIAEPSSRRGRAVKQVVASDAVAEPAAPPAKKASRTTAGRKAAPSDSAATTDGAAKKAARAGKQTAGTAAPPPAPAKKAGRATTKATAGTVPASTDGAAKKKPDRAAKKAAQPAATAAPAG